jgi:hypothetical protein
MRYKLVETEDNTCDCDRCAFHINEICVKDELHNRRKCTSGSLANRRYYIWIKHQIKLSNNIRIL